MDSIWNIISNISSIVTCIAFLLYLAGHGWIIYKDKHTLYEKLSVIPVKEEIDIEDEDNVLIVDTNGSDFILQSDYGIKSLEIYKIYNNTDEERKLKKSFGDINKEKIYIRCDLGEIIPVIQLEIEREDYTIITLDLVQSGKNGRIIPVNFNVKLTFKGFFYHLCV